MQDRKIKNVEVGDGCLESYPCQHGIKITYENGETESKTVSEITIASQYARFLKPYQRSHFGVPVNYTDETAVTQKAIQSVEVSGFCLESNPCQHGVRITYRDGTSENKTLNSPTIANKYAAYMPRDRWDHFGITANHIKQTVAANEPVVRAVDSSFFASKPTVVNKPEENEHVRRLTNVSSESRYLEYLNEFSPALQKYIEVIRNKKTHTDAIKELKITVNEAESFKSYLDPLNKHVMNVPVRFDNLVYDLDTLIYTIEIQGKKIPLFDIQPARDITNMIEDMIEMLKSSRNENKSLRS